MFGIPITTKAAYDHGNLNHIRRNNERRLGEIAVILVEWEPAIKRLYSERDSILSVLARINPPADDAAAQSLMGTQGTQSAGSSPGRDALNDQKSALTPTNEMPKH